LFTDNPIRKTDQLYLDLCEQLFIDPIANADQDLPQVTRYLGGSGFSETEQAKEDQCCESSNPWIPKEILNDSEIWPQGGLRCVPRILAKARQRAKGMT
jgi:hypothetical protein